MLLFSFRLKRLPVILGGITIVLVMVFGIMNIFNAVSPASTQTTIRVSGESKPRVDVKKASGKTENDRIEFLKAYGWELEKEPVEVLEVIIPKEFDEVYDRYNTMQKTQGFDLSGYVGKRCKRYAYRVVNYPGTEEAVRAHLLVYKDKIIGADVCSEISDGFIHGLQLD